MSLCYSAVWLIISNQWLPKDTGCFIITHPHPCISPISVAMKNVVMRERRWASVSGAVVNAWPAADLVSVPVEGFNFTVLQQQYRSTLFGQNMGDK